jgi:hypothetical protein
MVYVEAVPQRLGDGELCLHLALAVSEVRVEGLVGAEGVVTVRIRAEGTVRRHMHHSPNARVERGFRHMTGAIGVHLGELPHLLGVDDAGGVEHVGVGADSVEQATGGLGPGHVADDDADPRPVAGKRTQRIGLCGAVGEQPYLDTCRIGEHAVGERASEPAVGAGDDSGVGRSPTIRHYDLRRRRSDGRYGWRRPSPTPGD